MVSSAREAERKHGKTTESVRFLAFIAWTLGLMGLGLLVYRPWQAVPFDITDYSEILPLLTESRGPFGRLAAVVSYYLGHGRSNVFTSGLIWANWELFGLWAPGWRLFRAALFGILIWNFLRAAHRFGSTPLAAGLGSSLFVLSLPAAEGWLRFTGEPLAAVFFLAGLGVAGRFHSAASPARTSLVIAVLSASMILTKETMIVCVPLVILVALTWNGEAGLRLPGMERRSLLLVAVVGTTAVLLGAIISLVSSMSEPEAYARVYGSGSLTLARLRHNALSTIWPLGRPSEFSSALGLASSLTVLSGCWLAIHRGPRRPVSAGVLLLLLVSLSGAAVYLPWRRFEVFYAVPYLVGPAGLLAISVHGLAGTSRVRAGLAIGLVALLLLPVGLSSHREASIRSATRVVNWELARAILDLPPADSLLFAVPGLPDQEWQGRGPTLARYALAVFPDGHLLAASDEACSQLGARLREPPRQREILVSYHHWCGSLPGAQSTITQEFGLLFLSPPGVRPRRVAADILVRNPPSPPPGSPDP